MGTSTAGVDAPPMRQHPRKCAQQRLRARSPTRRSGGPTCRWRGNARLSATATLHHPPPKLQAATRPRHLIGSPSNLARISSMGHTMDPQRIRAQRRPDPPQSHQNCLGQFQGSQGARGHPRLKQTMPLTGLSAPKSPLPRRRAPNVTCCVARLRRGHTVIGRQQQIGRLENPQNW